MLLCVVRWLDGWEACEVAQGRYLDDDSMKFMGEYGA